MIEREHQNIQHILYQFDLGNGDYSFKAFGSGHINDTFLVFKEGEASEKYLLQRVNHEVFKDVDGLMRNMHLVTSTLSQILKQEDDQSFKTVRIIPTIDGKLYHKDLLSQYWRVQTFISDSISYDTVSSENQAYEAGFAFGKFQQLLSDMDVNSLVETIPDFHNMEYRFRIFEAALRDDPKFRREEVQNEISFALDRKERMESLYVKVREGRVPIRITHNDTKFNNVLLDKNTHKALCIIDLDTVMPGVSWYDFGDSIRTIINTGEEDEKDLEKIAIDMRFFQSFTEGYLQETARMLSPKEVEWLAFSAQYMTFIMGLRFLTDYISGDVYYKTKHAHHNLQRAKAQFRLVELMENQENEMKKIVNDSYRHFTNRILSS